MVGWTGPRPRNLRTSARHPKPEPRGKHLLSPPAWNSVCVSPQCGLGRRSERVLDSKSYPLVAMGPSFLESGQASGTDRRPAATNELQSQRPFTSVTVHPRPWTRSGPRIPKSLGRLLSRSRDVRWHASRLSRWFHTPPDEETAAPFLRVMGPATRSSASCACSTCVARASRIVLRVRRGVSSLVSRSWLPSRDGRCIARPGSSRRRRAPRRTCWRGIRCAGRDSSS